MWGGFYLPFVPLLMLGFPGRGCLDFQPLVIGPVDSIYIWPHLMPLVKQYLQVPGTSLPCFLNTRLKDQQHRKRQSPELHDAQGHIEGGRDPSGRHRWLPSEIARSWIGRLVKVCESHSQFSGQISGR